MGCVLLFCVQGISMGGLSNTYDSTSARTFSGSRGLLVLFRKGNSEELENWTPL